MKKKLVSTLLCAAMAVSLLAGCGGSADTSATTDTATEGTDAAAEETEAAEEAPATEEA